MGNVAIWISAIVCTVSVQACWVQQPGYSVRDPGRIVCGCHDGALCYAGAARTAAEHGETPESAETLMYYSQCACFQGSTAGCNTLGHFSRDYVEACERGEDVALACTAAGLVYYHGVQIPRLNGRSYDADPEMAQAMFTRACDAGSAPACDLSIERH